MYMYWVHVHRCIYHLSPFNTIINIVIITISFSWPIYSHPPIRQLKSPFFRSSIHSFIHSTAEPAHQPEILIIFIPQKLIYVYTCIYNK